MAGSAGSPVLGWAFVGSSGWVYSRFAASVTAAGHRVVGAYGSSPEGSARFAARHGCAAFDDLTGLLADQAVDVVWVASPTSMHSGHAEAAAAAGHAVLVEKPLTADATSSRLLAATLAATGAVIGVGFQHRFNPCVIAVREYLQGGSLGTLSSAVFQHAVAGPARPTGWRNDLSQSAGWSVADIGTHLLDAARHILGELELCAARLTSPGRGLPVDDLSNLVLSRGPATVGIRASTGTPGPPSAIEVSGTEGWVRVEGWWPGGGRIRDSRGRDDEIEPRDPYVEQIRAFSAAARGADWQGATLADGVRVSELLESAWYAGQTSQAP